MKKRIQKILAFLLVVMLVVQGSVNLNASEPAVEETTEITVEATDQVEKQAEKEKEKATTEADKDETQTTTEAQKEEEKATTEEAEEQTSAEEVTTETQKEEKAAEAATQATTEATVSEEETTVTEPTTEAAAEATTEAKAEPKTAFSYEDNRVIITAIAKKEANFPENTELKARYIKKGSDEYNTAVNTIKEQTEIDDEQFLDFVCYDVYFEVDGKEVEPEAGMVKVTIKYKNPIFQGVADEADAYATYHITDSNKVEDVTGTVKTNDDGAVTSVGFSTESFSIFVDVAFKVVRPISYNNFGLGTYETNLFTVETQQGGLQIAYCLESMRLTPEEGKEEGDVAISLDNKNLQKILYYGYGGPGDLSEDFYTQTLKGIIDKYKQNGAINDAQYSYIMEHKNDFLYILTHIAASKAYLDVTYTGLSDGQLWRWAFGENDYNKDTGRTSAFGQEAVKAWFAYLTNASINAPTGLKLTWSHGEQSTEITKSGANINVTNGDTFTLSGTPKGSSITIPVPEGLQCIINGDTDHPVVGSASAKATITSGDSFKFKAANKLYDENQLSTTGYNSGTLSGSKNESWNMVILYHERVQDIGAISCYDQTKNEMQYTLNFKKGSFKIVKKDDNNRPVAGAVFEIYRGKTLLGEVTTGSDGTVTKEIAYLDDTDKTITLKEKSAPYQYIIASDPFEVTLDEEKVAEVPVTNTLKKVKLSLVKKDDGGQPLSGATIGFYAAEDMTIGEEEVKANSLIGTAISGADGVAALGRELPQGNYYAKEIQAPSGYIKSETEVELTLSEASKTETVLEYTGELSNKTSVKVNKTDITGEKEVAGATISICKTNDDGKPMDEVVAKWTSDGNGPYDFGSELEAGKTYRLVETVAPDGYAYTESITFTVNSDGTVNVNRDNVSDNTILMKDDLTFLSVNKVDKNGAPVAGAKLVIRDADGIPVTDILTSGKEAIVVRGLAAGKYILSEIESPDGYSVSADVWFEVSDKYDPEHKINTVTMTDEEENNAAKGKVTVTKTLSLGDKDLPIGAKDTVFYVALFSDAERTQRVSDVKPLIFKNQSTTTAVFEKLEAGIYYVGETDAYGNLIDANAEDALFIPQYIDGYVAEITSTVFEVSKSINNRFPTLPEGYYYEGTLNITKKVLKGTEAWATDNVYYAGVFTDAACTQKATDPIKLAMNGSSETTAKVTVPLGEDPKTVVTYYVAETDENGVVLQNGNSIPFTISIDGSKAELSGEYNTKNVTITNTYDADGYYNEEDSDTDTNEKSESSKSTKSKKTGDNTQIMLYIMLFAAALLGCMGVTLRRKGRHSR